ncbi:MAG: sugar transferase [Microthrixaceae bacterium]
MPAELRGQAGASRSRVAGLDLMLFVTDALVLAVAAHTASAPARAAFVVTCLVLIGGQAGYRHRLSLNWEREFPRLVVGVAAAAALIGATQPGTADSAGVLQAILPAIVGTTATRTVFTGLLKLRRSRGHDTHPTIVVGAGLVGQRIVRHLQEHPEYGLRPVGFMDDAIDEGDGLPVLGRVADLGDALARFDVTKVIVAFGVTREGPVVDALRSCAHHRDVDVFAVPRFFEVGLTGGGYDDEIWGLPLVRMRRPVLGTAQWRLKRLFDTVAAAVGLVILSPLLLLIAVAIKATSPGPVFFRQPRVGQRGVPVDVLKFRTMLVNDDGETTWSVTSDRRVTRIGRVLRATSADELPQLINVVRGDMSLVGPRPERPFFVEAFSKEIPRYGDRHRVPVGMTGLAQVNGLRGDTSIEERLVFDNLYIENWSLWSDIVILLRTVRVVLHPPRSVRMAHHPAIASGSWGARLRRLGGHRTIDLTDGAAERAAASDNPNGSSSGRQVIPHMATAGGPSPRRSSNDGAPVVRGPGHASATPLMRGPRRKSRSERSRRG